jgi:hypothetical protein
MALGAFIALLGSTNVIARQAVTRTKWWAGEELNRPTSRLSSVRSIAELPALRKTLTGTPYQRNQKILLSTSYEFDSAVNTADGNCGVAAFGGARPKWVAAGPTLLLDPEHGLRFLHHVGECAVGEWGYQAGRPDQVLERCRAASGT